MGLRIGSTINVKNGGKCRIVAMPMTANQILPIVENETKRFQVNMSMIEPIKIDKDLLLSLGFRYSPCGASGADMWQGLGFWSKTGKTFGQTIVFRSKARVSLGLILNGYINSNFEYLHELENIYDDLMKESLYE